MIKYTDSDILNWILLDGGLSWLSIEDEKNDGCRTFSREDLIDEMSLWESHIF